MSITLTILGCGNSEGTPSIGNNWAECDPSEPKNRRLRPSVAVQSREATLIIDTGPDFKEQVNAHNINQIDAIFYTHPHGDHINGIDELRVWSKLNKTSIDVYGLDETLTDIKKRFDYHFIEKSPLYPAVLNAHVISSFAQEMTIADISFIPFLQDHGTCQSLGFRFGDIAYSTDLVDLSNDSIEILKGIKTWIVDGAGNNWNENPAHLSLERVVELNKQVGAEQVYITHLTRYMDYQTLMGSLPEGFAPAYDGLVLKN